MAVPTQCKTCGHRFAVKSGIAGRLVSCPECRQPVRIPAAAGDNPEIVQRNVGEKHHPEAVEPAKPAGAPARKVDSTRQKSSTVATRIPVPPPAAGASPKWLLAGAGGICLLVLLLSAAFLAGRKAGATVGDVSLAAAAASPAQAAATASSSSPAPQPGGSTTPVESEEKATAAPPPTPVATTPDVAGNAPAAARALESPATPPSMSIATPELPDSSTTVTEVSPQPAPPRNAVVFEPLPLAEPATSFAMTEDGKFLVITHQSANLVTIYDVQQKRVLKTLAMEGPRAVLCRGGRAFVANFPQGTISVLSAARGWARSNELQVDHPNVLCLSAAGGRQFQDELLVTCHPDGKQGSYQGPKTFHIDVKRDRCRPIGAHALATVSYDGKLVVTQGSFNLSPSGGIGAFSYAEFLKVANQPVFRGGIQQTPFVYQVHAGGYWFAENMIFGGVPVAQVRQDPDGILIPDLSQKVFYVLNDRTMSGHAVNVNFSELGKRKVELPETQQKDFSRISHRLYRRRDYLLDHPVAYTSAGILTLFVQDLKDGVILTARTAAYAQPADVPPPVRTAEAENPPRTPTPPEPPPAADHRAVLTAGLPQLVVEGKPFAYQLPAEPGVKYELLNGPPGLTLSATGKLNWKPAAGHIGLHELKIRVTRGETDDFERPTLEVIDQQLAAAVGGDLSRIQQFDRIDLDVDHFAISRGFNGKSLLLLQGDTLRILGPNGIEVIEERKLPERYHFLRDREDVCVAVSKSPPTLDVIDKKSWKRIAHHRLEIQDLRILDITDFTIHPTLPQAFVAIKHDVELPRYTVIQVNERSGRIDVPGILGTYVEIDPQGKQLYTGYRDLYERGVSFHVNPNWQLIEIPQYGHVDMLISWSLGRSSAKIRQVIREAGGNGSGIRLSPDGARLTYLSHVGHPPRTGNLAGINATNFAEPATMYATKNRGSTSDLDYHPTLPWAASPGSGSAVVFHRDTGELLEHKLLVTSRGVVDPVDRLHFSPDGQSLILQCRGGETGRYLCRIGLKLTSRELEQTRRPRIKPAPVPAVAQPEIPPAEFDALTVAPGEPLTPKEIGKQYMNSVVIVTGEGTAGTGFLIGGNGYILTCAHVLPEFGDTEVLYHFTKDGKTEVVRTRATIVSADEELDLALIKIKPRDRLPCVVLHDGSPVEAGEEITVIGNPGLGEMLLTHTMTTGIVSNPERELNGQRYIQTSAAINPGNSGGPMFDSHGRVVGVVSLKGQIEGAGFAVRSKEVRGFLLKLTPASKPAAKP